MELATLPNATVGQSRGAPSLAHALIRPLRLRRFVHLLFLAADYPAIGPPLGLLGLQRIGDRPQLVRHLRVFDAAREHFGPIHQEYMKPVGLWPRCRVYWSLPIRASKLWPMASIPSSSSATSSPSMVHDVIGRAAKTSASRRTRDEQSCPLRVNSVTRSQSFTTCMRHPSSLGPNSQPGPVGNVLAALEMQG